jgi:hypothetical protein
VLAHEPDDCPAGPDGRVPARPSPAGTRSGPSPDREVLDAARFRLSTRDGSLVTDPALVRAVEDIQSVADVRLAARYGGQPPPGPLDLGASLVMVGNLRFYLDSVEADLLDAATDLGMSWDLIAAILGIPAEDARRRLRELRARPDPG